jgi:hypothetical protein
MTPAQRHLDFVDFAKKVGIVAGATIAVVTLSGMAWSAATAPLFGRMADESRVRAMSDSLLVVRLERIEQTLDDVKATVTREGVR